MVTPVSMRHSRNTTQSLIHFLKNQTYAQSGASLYVTGTLSSLYPTLKIQTGYPDNLDKLNLPTIALVHNTDTPMEEGYGDHIKGFNISFSLFGFVGNQASHGHNMVLRQQLSEEIKSILDDIEYVTLYQYSDFVTSVGDIGIANVIMSDIPPVDETEAGRYQFVIDFEVEYLKKL